MLEVGIGIGVTQRFRAKTDIKDFKLDLLDQLTRDDILDYLDYMSLYQKDGKLSLDASTKFTNTWYLVKMAEDKGIEIREEKDLSLKQIKHL